jgi:hypothetical protein
MAEVEVDHAHQLMLGRRLPINVWQQVRHVRRDRCKFLITLIDWTDYNRPYREIEFPESWGLSSDQAVAYIMLHAW